METVIVQRMLSAALAVLGLLAPAPGSAQAAAERPASAAARYAGVASASQPVDERVAKRPAPRAPSRRRLAAWITSGVAAVALVGVASSTGYALSRAGDVNALYDLRYASGQPVRYSAVAKTLDAAKRDIDRADYAIFASYLTLVLAAGVSIYLWVTSRARVEKRAPGRAQLHLFPAVSSGSAALRGNLEH
jgi:kynureninase